MRMKQEEWDRIFKKDMKCVHGFILGVGCNICTKKEKAIEYPKFTNCSTCGHRGYCKLGAECSCDGYKYYTDMIG